MEIPILPAQHNLILEESLISTLLIDKSYDPLIFSVVQAEDFYSTKHQLIFSAMTELHNRNSPIDLTTVITLLQDNNEIDRAGGFGHISSIADSAPALKNEIEYGRNIKKLANLRRIMRTCNDIVNQCQKTVPNDLSGLLDSIDQNVFEARIGLGTQDIAFEDMMHEALDAIEKRQQLGGGLSGISSGFYELDRYLSGLNKGNMIILAARPAMGKTSLALNIARHVATTKPILFFSLEMPYLEIINRLIASESFLRYEKLSSGKLSQQEWGRMNDAANTIHSLPFIIKDTQGITASDIRSQARKCVKRHGELGLIVVDFIQRIKPTKIIGSRHDLAIADISNQLTFISKELNVPVLALSQLNRSLESRIDKRPVMSDLRESGALEQDAHSVIFIYRDDQYNKEPDNPDVNIAEIIIQKNRHGRTGSFPLFFLDRYTKFENISE